MPHVAEATPEPRPAPDDLDALVARARAGDPAILPQLRAYLDRNPAAWRHCGDLARHARDAWVGLIAGTDLVAAESLARRAEALGAELAGPAPSPLEGLLAERVVACWLQVHYGDAKAAEAAQVSLRQATFAQKRQDAAHRRYLSAVGALATVRRLRATAVEPANALAAPSPAGLELPGGPTATNPPVADAAGAAGPETPVPLALFSPRPPETNPLDRQRLFPTRMG